MVKVTFTLDDETVATLRRTAARLDKPQSQVVREAVRDYADRVGRLSERERVRMLAALDAIVRRRPTRTPGEVDRELREIRAARRSGGRRHLA
jgi:Ribbon-helix-helix protein, copG family